MERYGVATVFALILVGSGFVHARAGTDLENGSPTVPSAPASTVTAAANNGQLMAGAGGAIQPLPPATIPPAARDPVPPKAAGRTTAAPIMLGDCPAGVGLATVSPGSRVASVTFYPWFTRNSSGGYDGRDTTFGYDVPSAIPAGGDPAQVQLGAPATAANIAGHMIAVDLVLDPPPGSWRGEPLTPPYGGTCDGHVYGFSLPYLAGDEPVPPPPAAGLASPPFEIGSALLAKLTGAWRIGTVDTLPGPGNNVRTFVHIPTCAWLDTGVPSSPVQLHTLTTAMSAGYTLFLVYRITVTPGAVIWDWGDGSQSTSVEAPTTPPPTLPVYDAATQTWNNPCTVSHAYATVAAGRTITATQDVTVAITVIWSDGVATHTQPVACDRAGGGACTVTIGPPQGWRSGPHPVDQIEPIPFFPTGG